MCTLGYLNFPPTELWPVRAAAPPSETLPPLVGRADAPTSCPERREQQLLQLPRRCNSVTAVNDQKSHPPPQWSRFIGAMVTGGGQRHRCSSSVCCPVTAAVGGGAAGRKSMQLLLDGR